MKDVSPLQKINVLVKLQQGLTDAVTRGIKDEPAKILACYLACKLTDCTDAEIGRFFNIYPDYMRNQIETWAVHLLLDTTMKCYVNELETAYKELEPRYV